MAFHDESFSPIDVGGYDDISLAAYLKEHGLTLAPSEARRVAELLGRDPTLTEMTLFDTMWSEHCSYKSSRPHLKAHLPTTGDNVVVGPVEDAGIIDFGEIDGKRYGIIFAHESHNHPSQVMPVEGAATGIGGIVRDVYCMGGEVIATLDPLRFGWPEKESEGDDEAAHRVDIARQVVDGIWQYGNAIGVPNLGGDVYFHHSFNENCLVNVVAVGIVEHDHITHSAVPAEAAREPYDLILVGKPTDWSGMGGAAFASATLDAESAKENKGSVQTPDPFLKRILSVANRAVLSMAREQGVTIGFKDLGAGGVSCVTSELADAGGFGCDVDVQLVHQIADLPARVCACSETQERYGLAVPARLTEQVLKIYNEDFALPSLYEGASARLIGKVTNDRQYILRWGDKILCQAPIETITEGIRYDREAEAPVRPDVGSDERLPEGDEDKIADEWLGLMRHPNVASREYIYRHYDPEVQAATILRPGEADAGVIAPVPGSKRAVALSADGNPLLGLADPWTAGASAVLEACRNVACVGGEPAAVTDCLNFGNPEIPSAFWQFTQAVKGVGDACRGIGCYARPGAALPVVSGNVSFYNQSSTGRSVAPSPIVACVAVVDDYTYCRSQRFKDEGDLILMIGSRTPEMAGSLYLDAGFQAGRPAVPPLDFDTARCEIRGVINLVRGGLATAAHDISDGGLALCLSEMAMGQEAGSIRGARITVPEGQSHLSMREFLFSEAGGFLVTVPAADLEQAAEILDTVGVDWWPLGEVRAADRIEVLDSSGQGLFDLDVAAMTRVWQTALPRLMGGEKAEAAVPPVAKDVEDASQQDPSVYNVAVNLDARPRVAVVQLPGVNCEEESRRILAVSGAESEIFRWTRSPAELEKFDGYLIPGGFSYQDRVRAGAVAAKDPLLRVLLDGAAAGKPILGICNGCQVLVEAGLVPGIEPGAVEVALAANRFPGRRGYHSRWVGLEVVPQARTPFVEGLEGTFPLPIAHAEGRFTHEDPEFFARLEQDGLVALRYTALGGREDAVAGNPNGSLIHAAGLTNTAGNVLAMMPHPERAAQMRHVPEDLPHTWGRARRAAVGNFNLLENAGPGSFLMRRLVELC
ncbi:MAG: phosphoribosylformylglycinamidine synthase subunit PurL [Candidatus Krumholzibacteria bacterium]|nr:phosphoribosylformylglycinamidine synthase subunit PurL [Candidatus Krumholzibacteria bacterium]